MSKKYPGGYLTKTPPTVSTTSAQGVWTLEQAEYYQNAGLWPVPPDPYFNQVSLLLHGDGTNGSQNNTFLDSSTNNFTITRNGNVAQGTFSPFSLAEGQWSNYFDGSGDYLSVPDSTSFDFGTSDFTVECFACFSSFTSTASLISNYNGTSGSWCLQVRTDNGKIVFGSGDTQVISATFSPTIGTWYHFAVARSGTTLKIFVNGVAVASITDSTSFSGSSSSLVIGCLQNSVQYFNGYISNVRLVKGTAVYTSNFTPSTTPLTAVTNTQLLTCQSNRFVDNSSNNFTITCNGDTKVTAFSPFAPSAAYSASTNGGSGYFDGSGDYLSVPDNNPALTFGSNSFTVEFWSYGTGYPISTRGTSGVTTAFALRVTTNVGLLMSTGGGWDINTQGGTVSTTAWNHIALVRNGTAVNVYVNGQSVISQTISGSLNQGTTLLTVGIDADGAFTGYLSNVRIINGTALYTANFTPPTAPLTAVANTQLLLNCTNAAIYDNAIKNDVETVGNAQISTSVKKYGTGSMYFDQATGAGGFAGLNLTGNQTIYGTGDWTIEFWIYPLTSSSTGILYASDAVTGSGIQLSYNPTVPYLRFVIDAGNVKQMDAYGIATNAWSHFAMVRYGNNLYMYVNGVKVTASTTTASITSNARTAIGNFASQPFKGYLDEFRITNGVARYTSASFTPPNGPFPNV